MPVTPNMLPFGLRDVKLRQLTGEVAGVSVDLPNARTFSFAEAEDFEELRGDDGLVAIRGLGPAVDWELEGGGLSFEAVKIMYGGDIVDNGTNKIYRKADSSVRPYFQVEGQALSDSGGDFHVLLYRCRATGELSGELADGSFWLTGASGRALARTSDRRVYEFIQNENTTAIA